MSSVFEMKEQWMYGDVPDTDLFVREMLCILEFQTSQLELAQKQAFALQNQVDRLLEIVECHRRSEV